jgi:hypothetical protein
VKQQLSTFFLVVLSLPAVYKVGLFTFYRLNRHYIAENYCINKDRPITMCYGSCFLDKGLAIADQTTHPDSLTSTFKFEWQEFLIDEISVSTYYSETILTFDVLPIPSVAEGIYSSVFSPPLV